MDLEGQATNTMWELANLRQKVNLANVIFRKMFGVSLASNTMCKCFCSSRMNCSRLTSGKAAGGFG